MKKTTAIILLSLLWFFSINSWAADSKSKVFQGIGVLTGLGTGPLEKKGEYRLHPVIIDFDVDLKPFLEKKGFCPPGLFQFQLEPFMSMVSQPDLNWEAGTALMLKVGISPERYPVQPYVKAGLGILYMSQTSHEQSTQFNFLEQAGIGIHYFFEKDKAITAEGLYRHVSNASVKQPNSGINTLFLLVGITHKF